MEERGHKKKSVEKIIYADKRQLLSSTSTSNYASKTQNRNLCQRRLPAYLNNLNERHALTQHNEICSTQIKKKHDDHGDNVICSKLDGAPLQKKFAPISAEIHKNSCNEAYNELLELLENSPPKKRQFELNSFFKVNCQNAKKLKLSHDSKNSNLRKQINICKEKNTTRVSTENTKNIDVMNVVESGSDRKDLNENQKTIRCNNGTSIKGIIKKFPISRQFKYSDMKVEQKIQQKVSLICDEYRSVPHEQDSVLQSDYPSIQPKPDTAAGSISQSDSSKSSQHRKCVTHATNSIDIENLDDLLDYDWSVELMENNSELNLNDWKRCQILSIQIETFNVLLHLKEYSKTCSSTLSTFCLIKGYWSDYPFELGDIVSIKARYDSDNGRWCVDDNNGFIIKHPDILVTGTTIVGSLFCRRQAVLNYLFPGVDSKNSSMLVGSLVHEFLQDILRKKIFIEDDMKRVIVNLLAHPRTLFLAYEFDVSLVTLQTELMKFIPEITAFLNTYVLECDNQEKSWPGRILEISSIEENFWVPVLGMKGKADFVVKAETNEKIQVLPLELKTGRASNSAEHRGQIILYSMMMSELGMDTDSGLLLYLRQNMLKKIVPSYAERRGLISVRNNLVDLYIANEHFELSDGKYSVSKLPEPINHHSGCAKCPYLTICSATMSDQNKNSLSENNPLKTLIPASISHLLSHHSHYVLHWIGLLRLEEAEKRKESSISISDIWYMDTENRRKRGFCIDKLTIIDVQAQGVRWIHQLKRITEDALYDLTTSGLVENDYIVISNNCRIAVAVGFVHAISKLSISLEIDRQLPVTDKYVYVVDKYSVSESLLAFNVSCLLLLLENTDCAFKLRRFIIDKEMPSFTSLPQTMLDDKSQPIGSFFLSSKLNTFQKNAILKTLEANDYYLIKGLPGTGKTATIVALVKLLVSLKYSVLVTSQTHSAVDNIILRLKNSVNVLRLGSVTRVHPDVKSCCEENLIMKQSIRTTEELERFYNQWPVVGVTCMGCSHALLKKRTFDVCIVDEATQVLLPSVIRSLYSSRKFILVGDPNQLPPVVQSREASRLGLSESLFVQLDRSDVTTTLCLQYRMNAEIMKLANSFSYNNQLQCDNEIVNSATIRIQHSVQLLEEHPWLKLVLSSSLDRSVIFLNTSRLTLSSSECQYSNNLEADLVFTIVQSLTYQNVGEPSIKFEPDYDIGLIAPFRDQVKLLKHIATKKKYEIEINTVDQYQGRDKDVIIYSCTKHSNNKEGGILGDKRRLTVAITRAKRKLIIIGNITVLKIYPVFQELLDIIPVQNIISIDSL